MDCSEKYGQVFNTLFDLRLKTKKKEVIWESRQWKIDDQSSCLKKIANIFLRFAKEIDLALTRVQIKWSGNSEAGVLGRQHFSYLNPSLELLDDGMISSLNEAQKKSLVTLLKVNKKAFEPLCTKEIQSKIEMIEASLLLEAKKTGRETVFKEIQDILDRLPDSGSTFTSKQAYNAQIDRTLFLLEEREQDFSVGFQDLFDLKKKELETKKVSASFSAITALNTEKPKAKPPLPKNVIKNAEKVLPLNSLEPTESKKERKVTEDSDGWTEVPVRKKKQQAVEAESVQPVQAKKKKKAAKKSEVEALQLEETSSVEKQYQKTFDSMVGLIDSFKNTAEWNNLGTYFPWFLKEKGDDQLQLEGYASKKGVENDAEFQKERYEVVRLIKKAYKIKGPYFEAESFKEGSDMRIAVDRFLEESRNLQKNLEELAPTFSD